jgi:Protein-tyrosine-phosphatase-like, N-terminal domain
VSRSPRIPPSLEAAAVSLRERYAGRHAAQVVDRVLLEAYEHLSRSARVQDFVPIFAERAARSRLDAGAEVEASGRPAPRGRAAAPRRRSAAGSS